jgi:hypothetical protein
MPILEDRATLESDPSATSAMHTARKASADSVSSHSESALFVGTTVSKHIKREKWARDNARTLRQELERLDRKRAKAKSIPPEGKKT